MQSADLRLEPVDLDGQRLYLPTGAAIEELRREPTLDDRPLGVGRLFEQYAALAAAVPDLRVALGAVLEPNQPWMVYHLVMLIDRFARVRVEGQRCGTCGWSGLTGNAREFNIYIGTPDPLAAAKSHWDEGIGCPRCGSALPRPPVWTAPTPTTS
ncbi:MAG: hypothetical protein AAGF12_22815 [Myxococcota bacterium]